MLLSSTMSATPHARRVVLLVLDGLRADLVGDPRFPHLARLQATSACTTEATTVLPSVTAVAMTSLLSGLSPMDHGVDSDRFRVPVPRVPMTTLPHAVAAAGLPTVGVVRSVPWLLRTMANRIVRTLGMLLEELEGSLDDTLFIALADHGGGGRVATHHDSAHPFDCTIPIFLRGAGIRPQVLPTGLTLLDVPATALYALGIAVPRTYAGTPITQAFHAAVCDLSASAA